MSVLVLGGDVYMGTGEGDRGLIEIAGLPGPSSFRIANLEGPITSVGEEWGCRKSWRNRGPFRMSKQACGEIAALSAVSIANNHSLDYGVPGYRETIEALDALGVAHAGGGMDIEEAHQPVYGEVGSQKIALVAYTCVFLGGWEAKEGCAGMAVVRIDTSYQPLLRALEQPGMAPAVRTFPEDASFQQCLADIRRARETADVVVVSFHWGVSGGNRVVAEYQRTLGHACIDAGASIIFGHHPHVVFPVEIYQGRPILYSLGNLCFYEPQHFQEGVLVACEVEGRSVEEIRVVGVGADVKGRAVPLTGDRGRSVLQAMVQWDGYGGPEATLSEGQLQISLG